MKQEQLQKYYLLQINDALFPIGGYSHSQGLETYIQQGTVSSAETAETYITHKLQWGITYTDLLGVRLAWEAAAAGNLERLQQLENLLAASRLPLEQREASRKMGSRFVKTVKGLAIEEDEIFLSYTKERTGKTISHCVAYGVFCASLHIEEMQALEHYLYAQTSAMVTNCVKTIPLSQSRGQEILSDSFSLFPSILDQVMTLDEEDLCLSVPGFDLRGIQHEKLYSRLYMS